MIDRFMIRLLYKGLNLKKKVYLFKIEKSDERTEDEKMFDSS
jgi:hypothetical protein